MTDSRELELEQRLRDARRRFDALREGLARGERPDTDGRAEPGRGQDADGQVRAAAERGRLTALELDPRTLRLPPELIGERIAEAANAALADLRARSAAEQPPAVDPATLLEALHEVQEQGLRQMAVIGRGIEDAVARVQAGIHRARER